MEWVKSSIDELESGNEYRFVIFEFDSREIVDSITLNDIVKARKIGNLVFWGRGNYLNKGVCSLAEKLVIECALVDLNFNRIEEQFFECSFCRKSRCNLLNTFKNKISLSGLSLSARCCSVIPREIKAF